MLKRNEHPFPEKLFSPTDETTAILKEITGKKELVAIYQYTDGYYFKGTTVTFTEDGMSKLIKRQIVKTNEI